MFWIAPLRGGDAFYFAQHAVAVVGERTREQLLFVIDGDLVGALGRRQNGDDNADDSDGDDDANRDHHAQAGAVPIGVLPHIGNARASHSRHD